MDNNQITNAHSDEYIFIMNTCPDLQAAESIAKMLVEQRLVACVNIVPGIISMFHWKGQVEKEQEVLIIAKTRLDQLTAITETIKDNHPYELPEVISVPINDGLPAYLSWINENVAPPQ